MTDAPADEIRVLHLCEHFGNHEASFHGVARSFELWLPALSVPPVRVWLCSRAKPSPAALERYARFYVIEWMTSTTGGIIGAKVRFQPEWTPSK